MSSSHYLDDVDDAIHVANIGQPSITLCGAPVAGRNVMDPKPGEEPDFWAGCWMCIGNLRADREGGD